MENDGEFMPKINFAIAFIVSLYLFSDSFAMQNTDDIKQKGIAIQKNNEKDLPFQDKTPSWVFMYGMALFKGEYNGKVHPQDYKKAEACWYIASVRGHANAQLHLGEMYRGSFGPVVPQNYVKSRKWLQMAADNVNATGNVSNLARNSLNLLNDAENDFDEDAQGYDPEQDPIYTDSNGFARNSGGSYDTNEYAKRDHKSFVENLRENKN